MDFSLIGSGMLGDFFVSIKLNLQYPTKLIDGYRYITLGLMKKEFIEKETKIARLGWS